MTTVFSEESARQRFEPSRLPGSSIDGSLTTGTMILAPAHLLQRRKANAGARRVARYGSGADRRSRKSTLPPSLRRRADTKLGSQ